MNKKEEKNKREKSEILKGIIRIGGVMTAVTLSVLILIFGKRDVLRSAKGDFYVDSSYERIDGDLEEGRSLPIISETGNIEKDEDGNASTKDTVQSDESKENTKQDKGTTDNPLILEDMMFTYEVVEGNAKVVSVLDETAERLVFPQSIQTYPLLEIGEYACQNFANLKEVILPEGLEKIGYNAFENCVKLESINLPETITTIHESAFCSCLSLTRVELPKNLKTLEPYAFSFCDNLKELVISKIEGFMEAFDLWNIKKISIREGLTAIPEAAFEYCEGLEEIKLPNTLTNIRGYAFNGCTALKVISIPDKVLSIGEDAFHGCSSLTEMTLPEGLVLLSEYAFYDCIALERVNLPEGITQIGASVFELCEKVTLEVYENSLGEEYAIENDINYQIVR